MAIDLRADGLYLPCLRVYVRSIVHVLNNESSLGVAAFVHGSTSAWPHQARVPVWG